MSLSRLNIAAPAYSLDLPFTSNDAPSQPPAEAFAIRELQSDLSARRYFVVLAIIAGSLFSVVF